MNTYYAMSVPEIFVLLFVIFLWVLSIFCCFKRYEKSLSTIERADMPSTYKQNLIANPNSSSSAESSTSSDDSANKITINADNTTNSNTNNITISNATNMTESTNTLVAYQNKSFTTVNLNNHVDLDPNLSYGNLNLPNSSNSYKPSNEDLFDIHSNKLFNQNHSNLEIFKNENETGLATSSGSKSQYKYEFISYEKKHPLHNLHKFSIKQSSRSSSSSTQNNMNQLSFHTSLLGNLPGATESNASHLESRNNASNSNNSIMYGNNYNYSKRNKLIYLHNQFKNTKTVQTSIASSKQDADLEHAKHKLVLLNLPEYQSNMLAKLSSSETSFRKSELDIKKAKSEPMLFDFMHGHQFEKNFNLCSMTRDRDPSMLRSISVDINNQHSLTNSNNIISKEELEKDSRLINRNLDLMIGSSSIKSDGLTRNKQFDNTQTTLNTTDSLSGSFRSRHFKKYPTNHNHHHHHHHHHRKHAKLSIPSNEEGQLLNPDLIPKLIKKSLIDLHKKSMWNLAHKQMTASSNNTTQLNTSLNSGNHLMPNQNANNLLNQTSSNNLLAKTHHHHHHNHNAKQQYENHLLVNDALPFSQSNLSTTSVYTQPKNKNEIKMKIMENYV